MNILVVGGGGREHAICHALRRSPRTDRLYCAPGNGGIAGVATCVDIKATDLDGIVRFTKDNQIDFVMVAPDDPLALGLVNRLEEAGIRAFGPRAEAAIIESSKIFSKNLMKKYGIPTAEYAVFDDMDKAIAYVHEMGAPIVVKADGLALGKGVVVAPDEKTAINAVKSMMADKKFGASGSKIVIEACMTGPEVTVLAFTDGKTIVPMLSSQDHKRAFNNDEGPNTGGMGAFCPSPNYTPEIAETCMETIFLPTIRAMAQEGRLFKGVIYFGLMLTPKGPRVVEYNARFGDPETQPILTMLETDLLDIFEAVVDERLADIPVKWHNGAACCIVMASGGYPDSYEKGYEIKGLETVPSDITVYHAGTLFKDGQYLTNGGRVLGVTATGATLSDAVKRAYDGVKRVSFQNAHYRTDIGSK
ncbi:phosphoribosylamine--glycine ligase [Oscillospiraceae bacterium CM]|nr:phosphoribosylamine--glycine ligase [Oscillospiraceae bacterium CM]